MATSNMLSGRSKMFCHNCGSKELQECFFALNVEQSLKLLFHLFDNCCLPEIKRERRQKRLAYFTAGSVTITVTILYFLEKYHDMSVARINPVLNCT